MWNSAEIVLEQCVVSFWKHFGVIFRCIEVLLSLSFSPVGGLVYPVESVDLSRESRQVVSLRDDIADEINQLYFERARIRQRLLDIGAGQISAEPGEQTRLRWRSREIGAGLDAWTGGWLSRWTRDHALRRRATDFYETPAPSGPSR